MNNKKWSMERVFSELRAVFNMSKEVLTDSRQSKALVILAKKAGWKYESLVTAVKTGMYLETFDTIPEPDPVMSYYERRELEDRDETRSATGFNSRGDPVELDFN